MKSLRQNWAGLLAIFLIYFYFLEFSQFTLLHLLENRIDSEWSVKVVLGGMAAAGILGSLLAWLLGRAGLARKFFGPAFLVCGLVALASPLVSGMAAYLILSVVMGLAVGFLTVGLASASDPDESREKAAAGAEVAKSFYDFTIKDIDGREVNAGDRLVLETPGGGGYGPPEPPEEVA